MKLCTKCGVAKTIFDFWRDKFASDGLCFRCKECMKKANKDFCEKNADYMRAKVYEWREKNPDKYHAINAKSRKKNHARVMVSNGERRATEKRATPTWANRAAMRGFYVTAKALNESLGIEHQVDHIVPLKSKFVCGLHCEANLQVIPALENFKKKNYVWPDMPERNHLE